MEDEWWRGDSWGEAGLEVGQFRKKKPGRQVLERHAEALPSTASIRMEKTNMFQAGERQGS